MATDFENVKAMLDRAMVRYTVVAVPAPADPADMPSGSHPSRFQPSPQRALGARQCLSVRSGDGERNLGYTDFVSEFYFDTAGALVAVGAWE